MSSDNRHKGAADKEAILVALDQLSQTMDVMSQVIARLKRTVERAQFAENDRSFDAIQSALDALQSSRPTKHSQTARLRPQSAAEPATTTDNKNAIVIH